jgi:hypothetical protein
MDRRRPANASTTSVSQGEHIMICGRDPGGTVKATLESVLRSDDGRVVGIHHNSGERNGKRLDVGCCIVFEVKDGREKPSRVIGPGGAPGSFWFRSQRLFASNQFREESMPWRNQQLQLVDPSRWSHCGYFPLDHADYGKTIDKITSSGAQVVFNTIVPPGVAPFLEQLYNSGFTKRGGHIVCTYFDENRLNMVPAAHVEGLYSCLDYYQAVSDPFSQKLMNQYDTLYPGNAKFTAGSACSGLYRGLRLWEAAVKEAGSLQQEAVIEALDHAKIAEGPGGSAEMVPGQHHVRMNMYIAQARKRHFEIVKSLGVIDPNELNVSSAVG